MTEGKREIIRQLFREYDIESATDIQAALKDLLGGTIKEMMEIEMDNHLGYEKSESFISDITDKILPQIEDRQNRPLDEIYPIVYIDAIHYSVREEGVIRKLAAYVILGINTEGKKPYQLHSLTVGLQCISQFNTYGIELL